MDCEEHRPALIDDPEDPPAAARLHIAECAACRDLSTELREGLHVARAAVEGLRGERAPPLDVTALLAKVDESAPARRPHPVLRTCARAAAVLLATIGVLALFGSRVEAAEGTVRLSFALPGSAIVAEPSGASTAPAAPDAGDVLRALDPDDPESALRRAMKEGLVPLAAWLDVREARDTERLDELVAYVRGVHRQELLSLRTELDMIRTELGASRDRFAALSRPPALPAAD